MLSLLFLFLLVGSPKLQVNPHFGTAPQTVILLLTAIPDNGHIACFSLDGPNYYGGCQDIDGRRSIRIEYRDVLAGDYVASATIDEQIVSEQQVSLIGKWSTQDEF